MMSLRTSTMILIGLAVVGIALPFTGLYAQFLMKCVALALFAVLALVMLGAIVTGLAALFRTLRSRFAGPR